MFKKIFEKLVPERDDHQMIEDNIEQLSKLFKQSLKELEV